MQDTNRPINHRNTSFWTEHDVCTCQGIASGWADNYNIGIPCQWFDVTFVNTATAPVTLTFDVNVNPLDWLCEGVYDLSLGSRAWVPTGNITTVPPYQPGDGGKSIDKWNCTTSPGALQNNLDSILLTIPTNGNGYLTQNCSGGWLGMAQPHQSYGPKRDCEFKISVPVATCTPGQTVTLTCSVSNSNPLPQVLRVCEASHVLGAIPCRYNFEFMLTNLLIAANGATQVQFTCPSARAGDPNEIGGLFSLYSGALLNGLDPNQNVVCSGIVLPTTTTTTTTTVSKIVVSSSSSIVCSFILAIIIAFFSF